MASITRLGAKWRVQVARNGTRVSRVFATKAEANNWAAAEEAELLRVKAGGLPSKTLAQALDRYMDEISVQKRGMKFERLRLSAFIRDFPKLAEKQISEISTPDLAGWRDARLKQITKGSVQREINLLRNVFSIARDEWKWTAESPFKGMKMPGHNPARDRLPTWQEIKSICRWLGYVSGQKPHSKQAEVAYAFLISLRTGMRAGEVLGLSSSSVNLTKQVASVSHKTQHITGKPREVPLSKHAVKLLKIIQKEGNFFSVSSASCDALFRKCTTSLLIEDLHFHDARASALTRLSKKVDVMQLARISGHKDLKILLSVYYRETAENIAKML